MEPHEYKFYKKLYFNYYLCTYLINKSCNVYLMDANVLDLCTVFQIPIPWPTNLPAVIHMIHKHSVFV